VPATTADKRSARIPFEAEAEAKENDEDEAGAKADEAAMLDFYDWEKNVPTFLPVGRLSSNCPGRKFKECLHKAPDCTLLMVLLGEGPTPWPCQPGMWMCLT